MRSGILVGFHGGRVLNEGVEAADAEEAHRDDHQAADGAAAQRDLEAVVDAAFGAGARCGCSPGC